MRDVTRIIAGLILFSLFLGCGGEKMKSDPDFSGLPQKVNIPERGKIGFITPEDMVAKLNGGEKLQMLFIPETPVANPADVPPLPGLISIYLGEAFNYVKKFDKSQPVYLVCIYGDDSKRMCGELAKDGWNCYYLDGGTFRMNQLLATGKLKINAR